MWTRLFSTLLLSSLFASLANAQDKPFVDFQKHVQPILEQRCWSCHGPEQAKNDFRVDDRESLVGYIAPGDSAASTLWTDYLKTDDPDMLMPPASDTHPGGLSVGELLVIKTWIDEGAEGSWATDVSAGEAKPAPELPASDLEKWWSFQGLFHPATVHFPVALLSVSALFVLLSFFNRDSCEPVAYHCLWIGALGAAVACAAGWSYASYKGYAGVSFDLQNSPIDRHRWAGVFVAVFAFLLIPLARSVRQTGSLNNRIIWLLASGILAGGVSVAGYQGGELTYGEDHYMKYYRQLFPSTPPENTPPETQTPPPQPSTSETPDTNAVPAETPDSETPDSKTPDSETPDSKTPDKEQPATDASALETSDSPETPSSETP